MSEDGKINAIKCTSLQPWHIVMLHDGGVLYAGHAKHAPIGTVKHGTIVLTEPAVYKSFEDYVDKKRAGQPQ